MEKGAEHPLKQIDYSRLGFLFLIILFVVIMVRNAWMSDDAFITLRTVDNFVNGYGLTWNVQERVQAYTHPLWMFLLALPYSFTHEPFYTTIFLSLAVSLAAILVYVFGFDRSWWGTLLGLAALMASKSFIDYTTSGLENPLTYLLMVLFCSLYLKPGVGTGRFLGLSLIAGLAAVNRLDSLLIYLPALLLRFRELPIRQAVKVLALGFLPLAGWLLFSTVYYGFPLPNTAYAKLNVPANRAEIVAQGIFYLFSMIKLDPVSFALILLGIAAPLWRRDWRLSALSLGMALYLIYILWIGGDFMSGRFLSALVLMSILVLTQRDLAAPSVAYGIVFTAILLYGLSSPFSPLLSNADYGLTAATQDRIDPRGIADERAWYYPKWGLLRSDRNLSTVGCKIAVDKPAKFEAGEIQVDLAIAIGISGFCSGPHVYLIDRLGLGDPLMARLPPLYNPNWRVGHLWRDVPKGYVETVRQGKNQIKDEGLAAYYDQLSLITQGPIWSAVRLQAIPRMLLGRYDRLIDQQRYTFPFRQRLKISELGEARPLGAPLQSLENHKLSFQGALLDLDGVRHESIVEISLDPERSFQVRYLKDGVELDRQNVRTVFTAESGLAIALLDVPRKVAEQGYDQLWILPIAPNLSGAPPDDRRESYIIGHVHLLEH
jgi:arabinofuranosyltransferase